MRLDWITGVEIRFPLLRFGRGAALKYAEIWAKLNSRGATIGTHDMQIAAIALHEDCRVATLNAGEFQRVEGLEVIDATRWRLEATRSGV
jgi:tRNA(fMet)-specific endonuclease VapC